MFPCKAGRSWRTENPGYGAPHLARDVRRAQRRRGAGSAFAHVTRPSAAPAPTNSCGSARTTPPQRLGSALSGATKATSAPWRSNAGAPRALFDSAVTIASRVPEIGAEVRVARLENGLARTIAGRETEDDHVRGADPEPQRGRGAGEIPAQQREAAGVRANEFDGLAADARRLAFGLGEDGRRLAGRHDQSRRRQNRLARRGARDRRRRLAGFERRAGDRLGGRGDDGNGSKELAIASATRSSSDACATG